MAKTIGGKQRVKAEMHSELQINALRFNHNNGNA